MSNIVCFDQSFCKRCHSPIIVYFFLIMFDIHQCKCVGCRCTLFPCNWYSFIISFTDFYFYLVYDISKKKNATIFFYAISLLLFEVINNVLTTPTVVWRQSSRIVDFILHVKSENDTLKSFMQPFDFLD